LPTPSLRAFIASSMSLVMIFAAAGAPIPLFEMYRAEDGLHPADLALTTIITEVCVLFIYWSTRARVLTATPKE
jgi:hypothetical protein